MLIAPVPYSKTLSATVPANGFEQQQSNRATVSTQSPTLPPFSGVSSRGGDLNQCRNTPGVIQGPRVSQSRHCWNFAHHFPTTPPPCLSLYPHLCDLGKPLFPVTNTPARYAAPQTPVATAHTTHRPSSPPRVRRARRDTCVKPDAATPTPTRPHAPCGCSCARRHHQRQQRHKPLPDRSGPSAPRPRTARRRGE